MTEMSVFAKTIMENKQYAHRVNGRHEDWPGVSRRVAFNVVAPYLPDLAGPIARLIEERKFMPGGRYLYAAGRGYPQVNNCLAGSTRIITREGVRRLDELVGQDFEVLNRYGEWERAESRCFGVQTLYKVVFSCGAEVAATADHRWWQRGGGRVTTDELESVPHAVHAALPPVSAEGVRHGIVYGDGQMGCGNRYTCVFLCTEKKRELARCFEDREVEVMVGGGAKLKFRTHREKKAGLFIGLQPAHYKTLPGEDGAAVSPSYARGFVAGLIATDGHVKGRFAYISCEGWANAERIRELAVLGGCVVREVRVESTVSPFDGSPRELCLISITSGTAPVIRSDHREWLAGRDRPRKTHKAPDTDELDSEVLSVEELGDDLVYCCVVPGSESFTLASGLLTSNCFLFRASDSRDGPCGWADTVSKATNALMTGGGIGVVYSDLREEDAPVRGLGGRSTGPMALMKMVNECARYVRQGGSRRSAVWAGLRWSHKDIFKFIKMKDWEELVVEGKRRDFSFAAPMDTTNISVILDDEFFEAYGDKGHPLYNLACDVYWESVRHMLRTGEPGLSVDIGENSGENLRNACTEVTSRDDCDMCNLGSINLARINSVEEFAAVTELGCAFLLCGTLYSKLPIEEMYRVRERNRRIGLGLMGVHEWLLKRGHPYGPCPELARLMEVYTLSGAFAHKWADRLGISRPIATRSIAPTGTISIVAETTSGIEPIPATAYRRRYLEGAQWRAQCVVDPCAKRLIDGGVDPALIEDSLTLAEDVERRMGFQAWLQEHVDHGISSTINLPPWGSSINNESTVTAFGNTLLQYLPRLRGITAYPDGARGGQPIVKMPYYDAIGRLGVVLADGSEEACASGLCGA